MSGRGGWRLSTGVSDRRFCPSIRVSLRRGEAPVLRPTSLGTSVPGVVRTRQRGHAGEGLVRPKRAGGGDTQRLLQPEGPEVRLLICGPQDALQGFLGI